MVERKPATILRLPPEAYENTPLPIPPTMTRVAFASRVVKNPDGGVFVYWHDVQYPTKCVVPPDLQRDVDQVKKYIRHWLSLATVKPVIFFIPFVLLFGNKTIKKWFDNFSDFCYTTLSNHWLRDDWYSPPTREFRRVGLAVFGKDVSGERIIKSLTTVFEADRPYLWRFQDIVQLIRLPILKKCPAREIYRILKILAERDLERPWRGIAFVVFVILLFRRDFCLTLRKFFEMISLEKFWFDEADLVWALQQQTPGGARYHYLGMSEEERKSLLEKIQTKTL